MTTLLRSIATRLRPARSTTAPFSVLDERVRAARAYVLWVFPGVLLVVTLLTFIGWLVDPADAPVEIWLICLGFWVLQLVWIALVRLGRNPLAIAGLSFVGTAILEAFALFASPEPAGASSSLTFFVVAASYFLGARATIGFATASAAYITWASHQIPEWGPAYWVPSTAFVAFATGLLSAFVMSRSRRTERRLEAVAEDEREARERLEQVDASRDRLIANVSHELRTPLTVTIGAIETLLRDDVAVDQASRDRLMLVARDGGLRLLSLVEDLLTLGATRPDSLELDAAPAKLGPLARDAIVGIDSGEERSIRIVTHDDPWVRVDRLRMLQVIGNLTTNGVRHGEGDIVIEVARAGDEAQLRVSDDGPGVDPAHADELFLPFARFSTRSDSTGLGLAICRTIVEAHGGTIDYARIGGTRTAFTVRLPLERRSSQR